MSNFNIVFRNEIMVINWGEQSHTTILTLCDFMKVREFPINFFSNIDEGMSDLTFYFSRGKDYVIVEIDEVTVYNGDFSVSWNTYEYVQFFRQTIEELKDQRDEYDAQDELDELTRDLDILNLFEEELDDMSESEPFGPAAPLQSAE